MKGRLEPTFYNEWVSLNTRSTDFNPLFPGRQCHPQVSIHAENLLLPQPSCFNPIATGCDRARSVSIHSLEKGEM